jgi:hypothetical protein
VKIAISSGHGQHIRGAADILDEVDEARRVVDRVAEHLRGLEVDVATFHDNTSTSQNQNLETIVNWHNGQTRDLDISVHFNAYEHTSKPMGTEVLFISQEQLAEDVSEAIVEACGSLNRGAKYRSDLYFLNNTEQPSILIETVFVDSETDAELYRSNFATICQAIAEIVSGRDLEPGDLHDEAAIPKGNRVEIKGAVEGDVDVILNGQVLRNRGFRSNNVVNLEIRTHGDDVTVTINGQDFRSKPAIPANQCGITASMFGGESDYNTSAYDEKVVLNDTDLYVALPDRFEGERPKVRVYNRASGESAVASIEDVGPWCTDDPYWDTGTRPIAESGTDQSGRETNGAGIDLSPALADRLGIDGLGTVDWQFID